MGNLMGARAQMWTGELTYHGQGKRGQIIVRTEAIQASNEVLKIRTRVYNPNNVGGGCMGMCQERLEYRFAVQKIVPGTDNFVDCVNLPRWFTEPASIGEQIIPLTKLCNGNKDERIQFALVDRTNRIFNTFQTTVNALLGGSNNTINGADGTTLVFDHAEVFIRPSFVDYLRSGWQISLVAAIDYTASNGNPSSSSSLHFISDRQPNEYEQALWNVGGIIEPYDYDRSFPVFGFGGIPRHMGNNSVSHCFAINGNAVDPQIMGVQNIIGTYKQFQSQIGLGGPTLFGPLLQEFLNFVRAAAPNCQYPVLLLLTDGAIHDMPATRDLIYQLSFLPCSVIIIGVGSADFSSMEELDGDGGRLTNMQGQPCARDIVQFVEFREAMSRGDLAEQVLKEVPNQLVSYMEMQKIQPIAVQQNMQAFAAPQ